jgi:protein O-GlcNAc transferase
MTLDQALQLALQHHQAGRLAEAEQIYRQILTQAPQCAEPYGNLGELLRQTGWLDEAIAACQRAIQLNDNLFQAHVGLGNALRESRRFEEAAAAYRGAIQLNGNSAEAHCNLGNTLQDLGRSEEAIAAYAEAIRLKPDTAEMHGNLGIVLAERGRLGDAIAAYQRAIKLKPDYSDAYYNLGRALFEAGRLDEAVAAYEGAIRLRGDSAQSYNNLGIALCEKNLLQEAAAALGRAIVLKPDYAEAHNNLGNILKEMGRIQEAIAAYRRAVELGPAADLAHSNLVYALLCDPGSDAHAILAESRRWNEAHARPLRASIRPHDNNRGPDRRLRLGYVSPDFRQHVVGLNLLPALRRHDHQRFEIFCYSNALQSDSLTRQFQACADHWRDIARLGDEQAAQMIRDDKIDILVDLTLHMSRNRLLVFARKPAPVQVTYLGYCGTTGLETMDYRLSDPWFDDADSDLSVYSERTVRLPRSYWCYQPGAATPDIEPRNPAQLVTFGCLNNFAKVSSASLDLWSRILMATPGSRLILHAPAGHARQDVLDRLTAAGVGADRVEFVAKQPWDTYIRTYQRIDVALDPFPYGGGITTCDALWMGVPVVSLSGKTAVGRGGRSILNNIGLPELVANSPEQYLHIATDLAGDSRRLSNLRHGLRDRMKSSPLMDEAGFTRELEEAYRIMWRAWVD